MKKTTWLLALAVMLVGSFAATSVRAVTIANWGFEVVTPPDVTDAASNGPHNPDSGAGDASGSHASAATDWSTPAGNGSANSYSSNTWAVGDYYQFHIATGGNSDFTIGWDQTGSGTGPRDFQMEYSTNGTTYADLGAAYVVQLNGAPNPVWATSGAGLPSSIYSYTRSITGVSSTDLWFRMTVDSGTSINNGTIAVAGTGRVDNVIIEAVPEPSALILGGISLLGLIGVIRSRIKPV